MAMSAEAATRIVSNTQLAAMPDAHVAPGALTEMPVALPGN
jgi:hypothetical protein